MANFKAKLDKKFEYLGNQLSIVGLKDAMRCALKYERSRLRGLWEKDPSHGPPPNVSNEAWLKLKLYWISQLKQVAKSMV
jgi:hypothetical protein